MVRHRPHLRRDRSRQHLRRPSGSIGDLACAESLASIHATPQKTTTLKSLRIPPRTPNPRRTLLHYQLHGTKILEVALPVPLRSTFTYAVPASFNGEELIGRRVVVPFRNRAMVGVGLALSDRAPEIAGGKEIHQGNCRADGFAPRAAAEADRTRTMDQPLLRRADRRRRSAPCFRPKSKCAMIANIRSATGAAPTSPD